MRIAVLTTIICSFLTLSTPCRGAGLDDYYLFAYGITHNTAKAALLAEGAEERATCGTPLKHGLQRDWNRLEPATQKALLKQVALPSLPDTYNTAHFTIHYALSGPDAPHISDYTKNGSLVRGINYYDSTITSVADWVAQVANTFENVYTYYQQQGYRLPPGTYHVYMRDLTSQNLYGVTNSDTAASSSGYPYAFTSYLEISSDFTDSIYKPNQYSPPKSLQITAAHEFHHAIQYYYNYYFDIWYAEATSTWFEDEIYDNVNQLYNYLPAWFANTKRQMDLLSSDSAFSSQVYGRWLFNRYLVERFNSGTIVRTMWEKLATTAPPGDGSDIYMAPLLNTVLSAAPYSSSLANEFFGFAKRVYDRNWTSHPSETGNIATYTPVATYGGYPVTAGTAGTSITLPHYSFAYYRFTPSSTAPADLSITVAGTSGIKATAFKKVGSTVTEYPLATSSGTITVTGFGTATEAVLLVANVTDVDDHKAAFTTNGSGLTVQEPASSSYYSVTQVGRGASSNTTTTGGGGGGGGCFIATAAYGSYLHPQVKVLRDFRDDYLLTNEPGRAFVRFYYKQSPPIAGFIAQHDLLRMVVRLLLTPLVFAVAYPLAAGVMAVAACGGAAVVFIRRRRIQALPEAA